MVDDKELPLTKAEYEICEFLAKNRGQVFSKEQILEAVFGFDNESNDSTIITHIKNIRAKFADYDYMPIKTVWGIGYKVILSTFQLLVASILFSSPLLVSRL